MNTQSLDFPTPDSPVVLEPRSTALEGRDTPSDWDFAYDPVASSKTMRVSVHLCIRGRGEPLQYDLDEENR